MKNIFHYALYVSLLIAVSLASCSPAIAPPPIPDGEVVNVFAGTARLIVRDALAGRVATDIYVYDHWVMFAKALQAGDGWAFTVIDTAKLETKPACEVVTCGNLVNIKTWTGFREWLTANGWTGQILPLAVRLGKLAQTTFPTMIVLPVGTSIDPLEVIEFDIQEGIDQ
jgi:hypothetical protein